MIELSAQINAFLLKVVFPVTNVEVEHKSITDYF